MTTEEIKYKLGSNRLWNRISIVAGVFALLIGVLLIANYIQVKKADPIKMTVINSLVQRLNENPADSALRTQIRTLDLLSRKAYFTSVWQIRTGGAFFLAAIALLIISMQVVEYRRKINPVLSSGPVDETMLQNRKARKWILIAGGSVLLTAMVFAVLSSNDLSDKFSTNNQSKESSLQQDMASGNISVTSLDAGTADSSSSVTAKPLRTDSIVKPAETAVTIPESSDNYPNFRGIAGFTVKRNIPTDWDGTSGKNVVWKTAVPLFGHSSPVIWGGKIFVTGASVEKQEVYCIDANNGKILWSGRVGNGTKKPKVSEETGYAASSAVTDGSGVYAIFSTGDVAAFDPDGRKLWEKDLGLPDNHYGHASSLLCYNGSILIQFDQRSSQKVMALSAKTGTILWSTNRPVKTSWSSPILVNTGSRTELITVAEPYVAAYNPANGQELWKIQCIGGEVGPSLAYSNGIVYAINEYSKLTAIKAGDQPSILWQNDEYLSDIPSPAAHDKYLFVATSYGTLVCYDATTGDKYWEKDLGKNIFSSPMIVENKVYVLDIDGVMHIVNADKVFKLISEPKLSETVAATPAFMNGKIFIRGEQNLYCIAK
jgi:outer membrane protein assembly factor BamB